MVKHKKAMRKMFDKFCNVRACTCWFDSFKKLSWGHCCKNHDDAYINNKNHDKTKWQVDREFFNCVDKSTCKIWASVMWLGQNLFSWKAWKMYKTKEDKL